MWPAGTRSAQRPRGRARAQPGHHRRARAADPGCERGDLRRSDQDGPADRKLRAAADRPAPRRAPLRRRPPERPPGPSGAPSPRRRSRSPQQQDEPVEREERRCGDRLAQVDPEHVLQQQPADPDRDRREDEQPGEPLVGSVTSRRTVLVTRPRTMRSQSRRKYTISASAVATCRPTTNARYGDSGASRPGRGPSFRRREPGSGCCDPGSTPGTVPPRPAGADDDRFQPGRMCPGEGDRGRGRRTSPDFPERGHGVGETLTFPPRRSWAGFGEDRPGGRVPAARRPVSR